MGESGVPVKTNSKSQMTDFDIDFVNIVFELGLFLLLLKNYYYFKLGKYY